MRNFLLGLFFCINFTLNAQKNSQNNKYAIGLEVSLGHSFPNFTNDQDLWSAGLYPSGSLTASLMRRFNQHWSSSLGLGLTAYFLTNHGPVDKYILDFASPHFTSSFAYTFRNTKGQENFLRLTNGLQLGYQGTLVDQFEAYTVVIEGQDLFYYFLRPEIGIRRYFKQKMKGSRFQMAYEVAAFFNYHINPLGTVQIYETDQIISLEPRGSVMGVYVKFLFPSGRERIRKLKTKPTPKPPTIYHPRMTVNS
jgi:hypothetical protein